MMRLEKAGSRDSLDVIQFQYGLYRSHCTWLRVGDHRLLAGDDCSPGHQMPPCARRE